MKDKIEVTFQYMVDMGNNQLVYQMLIFRIDKPILPTKYSMPLPAIKGKLYKEIIQLQC